MATFFYINNGGYGLASFDAGKKSEDYLNISEKTCLTLLGCRLILRPTSRGVTPALVLRGW
jgi:hypothetical protein